MGSAPISTTLLITSLVGVFLIEAGAATIGARLPLTRLWMIAATRTIQTLVVLGLATTQTGGVRALGLNREDLLPGLKKGLSWSAAFAAIAGLLFLGLSLAGQSPLSWIRSPLPVPGSQRGLFFLVGGIIAPLAEEVVFRGLIFGYLRRWGVSTAVLVSTALFAAIHPGSVLPVTQVIGGLVFAVAYHTSGSLMTPITIHTLGNLAIFTLSLPRFH